ncbi:MAG: hypothetical protein EOP85_10520 [Verrucomicrobiaceae bacterium]|nr:MAG: hypothetical protein EOP85_10520 [Verrucomicrobiaceae bacterium]
MKRQAAPTANPPATYAAERAEKPVANPSPGSIEPRIQPINHGERDPTSIAHIDIIPTADAR